MLLNYLKSSFARKKARRFFNEYDHQIDTFQLAEDGTVEFANWKNPLVTHFRITQPMINFFKPFIPQGSLAIDIGTNIGDTTVPMALAAGKEGLVLGFDPNPHVFKILTANAGLNRNKANIIPLPYAITKEDGDFYYASSEASFSNGGISTEQGSNHGSFVLQQKIRGVNLESYLRQHHSQWIDKLSFIKIDAEGHDKVVIESIYPLIEKYKPIVVAEVFSQLTREERKDLFDCMAAKNYDLFYFGDFVEGTTVRQITSPADMSEGESFNFYAKPSFSV